MDLSKRIQAICLILIMAAMMMHSFFPHFHHQHEPGHAAITAAAHHHHQDHHHHDHHHDHSENDHSEEKRGGNFLNFLLEAHTHSLHTHQYTPLFVESFKPSKANVTGAILLPKIHQANRRIGNEKPPGYIFFNQAICHHPYLDLHTLRGPPSLG